MARISGVDLPRDKRIEIGLTYVYGIGKSTAKEILKATGISEDVRVKDLTEEEIAKLKKEIEENQIQIHIECPEKPVMAEINIEQMNKALGSILKNSIYALLRKLQKQSFSPFITIKLEERSNNTVFISIYDNGIGIEDSIKDKIFEPFFTTKPSAEAAGVGLYLCREVILNHQGSILAKSEKDNYTEFLITIPISQKRINNE